jgi:4-hydroxythreonine-4-phosphate dehydrogenase
MLSVEEHGPAQRTAPLALTMGDPAGIGPELVVKAFAMRASAGLPPFATYGDASVIAARARLLGVNCPIVELQDPNEAPAVFDRGIPVIHIAVAAHVEPGQPDAANGPAVIAAIARAVADAARGKVRALVTNPISKAVLYHSGFPHPGHTEFLAALAEQHWPGQRCHPVMMLASTTLKVVPLTIHIPLANVPPLITRRLIFETARVTWDSLRRDFGIDSPRIAVAGLNPHAGEGGTIGREDIDIIAPAIAELRREGLHITGPHSADTLFHGAARQNYDVAIAMYHDQALIPIKTLAFDEGVNVTLGLPFVRTSPDHGTAFDIAAKGSASATSLIEALKLADTLAVRRRPPTS